jgi:hypothetical protein
MRNFLRILPGLTIFVVWLMAIGAAVYFEVRFLLQFDFSDQVIQTIIRWAGYVVLPIRLFGGSVDGLIVEPRIQGLLHPPL